MQLQFKRFHKTCAVFLTLAKSRAYLQDTAKKTRSNCAFYRWIIDVNKLVMWIEARDSRVIQNRKMAKFSLFVSLYMTLIEPVRVLSIYLIQPSSFADDCSCGVQVLWTSSSRVAQNAISDNFLFWLTCCQPYRYSLKVYGRRRKDGTLLLDEKQLAKQDSKIRRAYVWM